MMPAERMWYMIGVMYGALETIQASEDNDLDVSRILEIADYEIEKLGKIPPQFIYNAASK